MAPHPSNHGVRLLLYLAFLRGGWDGSWVGRGPVGWHLRLTGSLSRAVKVSFKVARPEFRTQSNQLPCSIGLACVLPPILLLLLDCFWGRSSYFLFLLPDAWSSNLIAFFTLPSSLSGNHIRYTFHSVYLLLGNILESHQGLVAEFVIIGHHIGALNLKCYPGHGYELLLDTANVDLTSCRELLLHKHLLLFLNHAWEAYNSFSALEAKRAGVTSVTGVTGGTRVDLVALFGAIIAWDTQHLSLGDFGTDISQKDEKPSKKRQNRTRDGKVCEDEAKSKSSQLREEKAKKNIT
ncbi:hypothetical protein Tco_1419371 [Tanacetum coccineum]